MDTSKTPTDQPTVHTVPSIQLGFELPVLMYPVNPVWLKWGQCGCMDRGGWGAHLIGTRERSFIPERRVHHCSNAV